MIADWSGLPVLVTGGAGFLGGHLVERLAALGARVTVPRSREWDLRSLPAARACLAAARPRVVFHCAAVGGGIGWMRAHRAEAGLANAALATALLTASAEARVECFVGVSSACAYPASAPLPLREADLFRGPPEPTNGPYGEAKRLLVSLGAACRAQYGLHAVFAVPTNLSGPRDRFDPERSHVVPALIRRFEAARLASEPEVVAWGTGRATRELLYVEDCAEGLVRCAETLDGSEPVNLGTGQEIALADLAAAVARAVGYAGAVRWDPSFPDGAARKVLDVSGARARLGWTARTRLDEGLARTVAWWRAQERA